jgi:hypothetical protein
MVLICLLMFYLDYNNLESVLSLYFLVILSLFFFIERFSLYKHIKYNLILPETQAHNYHLFDEQARYLKEPKYTHRLSNGFSVLIPFLLSVVLFLFCFFFVNYMWSSTLYLEIFGFEIGCRAKHHVHGYRNPYTYVILAIWLVFLWFDQIQAESRAGYHVGKVNQDYRIGFILFLAS